MSDCRLKNKEVDVSRMLGLNRNCSYKLYCNSNKESRGVCVAIRRNINHEVLESYKSLDQNVLLLKVKIKGELLTVGSVYGPNESNPEFYRILKSKIIEWGLPFILGGDFNTILDRNLGDDNLDKIGRGRPPNIRNSEILTEWIETGNCIEPFRAMYPETREVSYLPFRGMHDGNDRYGKTRLDFFLINRELINRVIKVKYTERSGFDFDHKCVVLNIGKKTQPGKITILRSTLDNELGKSLGKVIIVDTVNNHRVIKDNELSVNIGTIIRKIREILELEELKLKGNNTAEIWREIENLKWDVSRGIFDLPEMEVLLLEEVSCGWSELYEAVACCLKTHLLDLQSNLKKLVTCKREWISGKIRRMELLFGRESDQVADAIQELNKFDDEILKENANKYRDFFYKNNEKPSKAFCLLGRENNMMDDTDQIKNKDGIAFQTNKERAEYMKGYYEGLYKKRLDNLIKIEDFLTNGVCEQEWVRDRKLSADEQQSLEGVITMDELTKAMKGSNLQSSNGWDGISYVVLKNYFGNLGPLLVNMANECFDRGELTSTFRMGLIKLIPKKGEAEKIEDWRPITLLCCGYKLISGVVAIRLEKYLKKIIGMSQKGFLRYKNMSTCTINIMDRIANAWDKNETMGVLCIDFVKAFDSIEHAFIRNVMLFFNFGPRFIGMVTTLIKNRTARIIVNDGYSETFRIERGTPQGDRSSPYIFLLCIEVLLIKIKSEAGIKIKNCDTMGQWLDENGLGGEGLSEGFADDLTAMFKMEPGVIGEIVSILNGFYLISGLSLNVKKTQLMVVGSEDYPVGSKISEIEIVDKVKILGMTIDRRLERLSENWDGGVRKIEKLVNFWKLQRLSITGRILVAKSYMLSQVIFLLSTLHLDVNTGDRINTILANYVKGSDRIIAKSRWTIDRALGGYGLIDVHMLSTCMKANWINRWIVNPDTIDINGMRAMIDRTRPVDQWGVGNLDKKSDPTIFGIMTEWKNYKRLFYKVKGNIGQAVLFLNDGLLEGKTNLGVTILGREKFNSLAVGAKCTRIKEFYVNGRLKEKNGVEDTLGLTLNMAEYFRFRNIMEEIARNFGGVDVIAVNGLEELMHSRKRSGGEMRRIITGKLSDAWSRNDPRNIASVRTFWGGDVVTTDRDLIELNCGLWGNGKLGADFRMFLFNMVQGRLYLNSTLAHFAEQSSKCTFCEISAKKELTEQNIGENRPEFQYYIGLLQKETTSHIFWECELVQPLIQKSYRYMRGLDWIRGQETIGKKCFLTGINNVDKKLVEADVLWKHYLKFYIYKSRIQKKIPMFPSFRYEFENLLGAMNMVNIKIKMLQVNSLYI